MSSLVVQHQGRKKVVKVAPGTSLAQVRDAACTIFGLDPTHYSLVKAGKQLDLTLVFRLSGLASGQVLDLKPAGGGSGASVVAVALQLPSGERVQLQAPSSATLWDVLAMVPQSLSSLIDKDDLYQAPMLTFMNREITGNVQLQTMTLQQLGITSGSALLRMALRNTGKTLQQVTQEDDKERERIASEKAALEERNAQQRQEAEKRKQEEEARAKALVAQAEEGKQRRAQEVNDMILQQQQEEMLRAQQRAEQQSADQLRISQREAEQIRLFNAVAQQSVLAQVHAQPKSPQEQPQQQRVVYDLPESEKGVTVYPPSDAPFDPSSLNIPDQFYEVTTADLTHLMEIERRAKAEEDAAKSVLRTREMRERDQLRKWQNCKKVVIRVRFPDRIEVQRAFHPRAAVGTLHEFVKSCLAHPEHRFVLYTSPPVQPLGDERATLIARGLAPAALVYFRWQDSGLVVYPLLREDLMTNVRQKQPPDWSAEQEAARLHLIAAEAAAEAPELPRKKTEQPKAEAEQPPQQLCVECWRAQAVLWCRECCSTYCEACSSKRHAPPEAVGHSISRLGGDAAVPAPTGGKKAAKVPAWFAKGRKF
eukprot:TRINITY_DN5005_c0_g1_i2.p1 TRINITY_DN5005_c0_g1~~TRINITY_DN5005_c0_g1_i2.p1  ORF type:complete len:593 (+),score=189.43 TRINITY_DN5005_c0_g1_i2:38-1816(+)